MYIEGIHNVVQNGNVMVEDIQNYVVEVAKNTWKNSIGFSHIFDYGKNFRTAENLFWFTKKIPYKMDTYDQVISPANATMYLYINEKKSQDCKNKSIFICSVLKCLGFQTGLVFCGFNGKPIQHVYNYFLLDGNMYFLDSVIDLPFREENNITTKEIVPI